MRKTILIILALLFPALLAAEEFVIPNTLDSFCWVELGCNIASLPNIISEIPNQDGTVTVKFKAAESFAGFTNYYGIATAGKVNVVAAEKQLTQSADKEEDKLTAIKETRKIANMAKKAYCKDKVKWENNAFEKAVFEFENGNLTVRRYQKDNCYWAEVKATIKE